MYTFILAAVAILPAIFLCIYIYKKDTVEKEPIGLLVKLFFLGVVSVVPAFILETLVSEFFGVCFNLPFIGPILDALIGVAVIEEGCKLFFLHIGTRNSKEFNYMFDAIVYSVFISLGFAALENVGYVFQNGLEVGIVRAVLSIPGHMFFAIAMGYYYGQWNINRKLEMLTEKNYVGLPTENPYSVKRKKYMLLALIIPTLIHGIYDYLCLNVETYTWFVLLFIVFVIAMYIYFFNCIRSLSKNDVPTEVGMRESVQETMETTPKN